MQGVPSSTIVTEIGRSCNECNVFKPWKEFDTNKTGHRGHRSKCKVCRRAHDRRRPSWRLDKEKSRRHSLKAKYGMTLEEYDILNVKQEGLCAICGNPETRLDTAGNTRPLSVDHCHQTGKIRGLLCHDCNRGIGLLKDNIDLVYKAYEYLKGL